MAGEITNIGLIKIGSIVKVPITICNKSTTLIAPSVSMSLEFSYGLTYYNKSIPRGTFDNETFVWDIGEMGRGECLVGEFSFLVIDDRYPQFDITYSVNTTDGCPGCENYQDCITLSGLSCSEFQNCGESYTISTYDTIVECGGGKICTGGVFANDADCVSGTTKSYKWLDTSNARGTIDGDPNGFAYTAEAGFCGQSRAKYGMYCGDTLVDTATTHFNVTCAAPQINNCCTCSMGVDAAVICNVSDNDLPCLFGVKTGWHLVTRPGANGPDLDEATSSKFVKIKSWTQETGRFTVSSSGGYIGEASFFYTIRCYDKSDNILYESGPTCFKVCVDPLTPGYAPSYVPTYTPNYHHTYTPSYTPIYSTPTYTPIYTPIYAPVYTPYYTPIYTPIYTTPNYTPTYIHTYVPNYTPN